MLFDLRGRGRRRMVQAIYLTLAVLMGGGLVFFGIGGNTSGGLFDAFSSDSGGGTGNEVFEKRLEEFEQRTATNAQDAAAWAGIAKLRYQLATSSENYNQEQQAFTDDGIAELRRSGTAWDRYLALSPAKPDPTVAILMTQAFGPGALAEYDKAVRAMEIVIDSRDPATALYAQLAVLAQLAGQTRKSTLATDKAVELADKDERETVRAQIEAAKTQAAQQQAAAAQG